jgi:primosomal protein N' (replication factor Y)
MTILEIAVNIPINKTYNYLPLPNISAADTVGKRVRVPFGAQKLVGFVLGAADVNQNQNFKLKEILEVIDAENIIFPESIELAKYISQNFICSIGEALSSVISPSMRAPKRIVTNPRKKKNKTPVKDFPPTPQIKHILNPYQQSAVSAITQALSQNQISKPFLIHGVTASGKTEVYLNCIEHAIKNNKSTIMLIPEISLTAQFVEIVNKRFPDSVGLWHSEITNIEKYKLFHRAFSGQIKVMLGARSAIFAPFENLGLIIIDEEHEHTYKQEQKPSYDTRDIAFWRARYYKAVVVLGSATPSLETYKAALDNDITLINMPKRIDDKLMPTVEIISMKERIKAGGLLLTETVEAISKTLKAKEQVVVFLNRRGFSPAIVCRNCESVYQCPNCSISMTYHAHPKMLRCHYCGYTKMLPIICPECGSKDMSVFGVGTQRVEEELNKLFPEARIFRLDGDTATSKENYEKAFRGIKDYSYDILLGTQMIAKGFDFPRVSLVCIINADTALYLPDFKSTEKTFQLITQVAGRCGRGKTAGKVIVQTSHPEHYAIKYAKQHDYQSFYNKEVIARKSLIYPPFCDIAKIVVKNKNNDRAESDAQKLFDLLVATMKNQNLRLNLLGPAPAYIAKLFNIYRQHIIIKGEKPDILKLLDPVSTFKPHFSQTQISMEMSPSDLF